MTAVALNWMTTGDHLLRTIAAGYWPVAGFDFALLTVAGLSVFAARRLRVRTRMSPSGTTRNDRRLAVPGSARG